MMIVTTHGVIYAVTGIITAIVAIVTWKRRHAQAGSTLFFLMLFITLYDWTAAMEACVRSMDAKIFWSQVEYIGVNGTVFFVLIFTARFSGMDSRLTGKSAVLLAIPPCLNFIMAATNGAHGLLWSGFYFNPEVPNILVYERGPYYSVYLLIVFGYVGCGTFFIVKKILSKTLLFRYQSLLLLVAFLAPWVGSLVYVADIVPIKGLDTTPMSFAITGVALFLAFLTQNFLDLVPIARDYLLEYMRDPIIVFDRFGRIVDGNQALCTLFDLEKKNIIGTRVEDFFMAAHKMDFKNNLGQGSYFVMRDVTDKERHFEIGTTIIKSRKEQPIAWLVVLRDITLRMQSEIALNRANKELNKQLVEITNLKAKLEEESIRDHLTGLFNRRFMEETLPREIYNAQRKSEGLCIVMLDLDKFKILNDTYGHVAGDRVLALLGSVLLQHIRSGDLAGRYGGEEFLMVLPSMRVDKALIRMEGIRQSFSTVTITYLSHTLKSDFSAGIAGFPQHGTDMISLIRAADTALYQAKHEGRGRVIGFKDSRRGSTP